MKRVFWLCLMASPFVLAGGPRTSPPDLKTSAAAGAVRENLRTMHNTLIAHQHDGTDGSSVLNDARVTGTFYIDETGGQKLIMRSPDGSCSACGPDNSDTWSCTSTTCPS